MNERHQIYRSCSRDQAALKEIAEVIARYIPPDSGQTSDEALRYIIEVLETKTCVFDQLYPEPHEDQPTLSDLATRTRGT